MSTITRPESEDRIAVQERPHLSESIADSHSRHTSRPDATHHAQSMGTASDSIAIPEQSLSAPDRSLRVRTIRAVLVALPGHCVSGLLAALCLSLVLASRSYNLRDWLVALGLLGAVRVGFYLFSGPIRPFSSPLVRKTTRELVGAEAVMFTLFAAGNFLLVSNLTRTDLLMSGALSTLVLVCINYASRAGINAWRRKYEKHHRSLLDKQVVIVGTGDRAKNVADRILAAPELDTTLRGFLDFHKTGLWRYRDVPLLGSPDEIRSIIAAGQVDAVIIAANLEDIPATRGMFAVAEEMGIPVYLLPDLFHPRIARGESCNIDGAPALVYRSIPESRTPLMVKAILDRIGAIVGLALTSPIIVATALAIKLDSPGPIFFRQRRCGRNGRPFHMLKFRTMFIDAEARKAALAAHNEMSGPVFKMAHDPRITRVGRLLRKYSIDEIPQFFNVLRGDMSLVGPRPPLPSEVVRYEPWQHRKLSVKPGLTCIWQVSGRNNIDFEDWMRLDLQYIDNWSLWLDAKIIAKTVPTVVNGSGK